MKIKNAYIVHIDFDGDIASSKYCWGIWLVFTELEEVKSVVVEALTDFMQHQIERGREATVYLGSRCVSVNNLLKKERLLKKYIERGGSPMGNWEISIYKTEA